MLLAARCGGCGQPGPSPCLRCHHDLRAPAPEADPPGLEGLIALLRYDGPARALVAGVKYRNRRQAVDWLASGLAERVAPHGPFSVVTWAPTVVAHRRSRGFDHAEIVARSVGRRVGAPTRPLLRRVDATSQTGRPAHERRSLGPVFAPTRRLGPGAVVLLLDDVVTTGATLRSARDALRRAGAERVVVAALARTPGRRRAGHGR